jgi:hypothetical protein
MNELQIVDGTTQLLLKSDYAKPTVSSFFEYVSGSLNSPYIITSSAVSEPNKNDVVFSRR